MNIKPYTIHPTNFAKGRSWSGPLDMIVDHVMEGSMIGTLSHFRTARPNSPTSAHYGVGRDGLCVQYVGEAHTAYHAGRVDHPTAPLVIERPGINPNSYSIGIEHEGSAKDKLTPEQLEGSAQLHADIIRRNPAIFPNRRHIVGHREVYSLKTCPGGIDIDAILQRTLELLAVVPKTGDKRWSGFFREHVILTHFVSDTEWYFIRESELAAQGRRATSPWSDMAPERP